MSLNPADRGGLRIAELKDEAARDVMLEAERRGRAILDETIGKNTFKAIDTIMIGLASMIAEMRKTK